MADSVEHALACRVGPTHVVRARHLLEYRPRPSHTAESVAAVVGRLPASQLETFAPGAELTSALDAVGETADLDDAGLLELVAAHERQASAAKAAQVEALAELARRRAAADCEFAEDEVAFRLRWGVRAAQGRIDEATQLADALPRTLDHLAAGRLDYARARVVATGTAVLDDDDAAAVDAAIADDAPTLTARRLRERVALEVAAIDAAAAARRHAKGVRERRVVPTPLPDGLAELVVTGPAADVLTMFTALDGLAAHRAAGDDRGIDARRFDALAAWAQAVLASAEPGAQPVPGTTRWSGSRPHILLTMAATTLAGDDDNPCHLHGYGPLPAAAARELASKGAVFRRLLTDPFDGTVVGVDGHAYSTSEGYARDTARDRRTVTAPASLTRGTTSAADPRAAGRASCPATETGGGRYRPGAALARLVRTRHPRCTAPGCWLPSARCDLDHLVPHPDGPTCVCNLHPLCRRHHRMKHETSLRVTRLPDGSTRWQMRTGHSYTTVPPPALPVPTVRPRPTSAWCGDAGSDPAWEDEDRAHWGLVAMLDGVGPGTVEVRARERLGDPPF